MQSVHAEHRRLTLVHAGEELHGTASPALERAARLCAPGDRVHRGLVLIGATIGRRSLAACVPPGARAELEHALDCADRWAREEIDWRPTAKARSDAYAALVALERRTIEAVQAAISTAASRSPTALDAHADRVVLRYVGLSANYAASAILLALDAVRDPAEIVRVPGQAAGALAYQAAGLGPARSTAMRHRAIAQAEWESERQGAVDAHGPGELALQLFHEFLGAYWKDRSDAQRAYFSDFVEWALAGAS